MDLESVKEEILILKPSINWAISQNQDCKFFLENEVGKSKNEIEKVLKYWEFAFQNASNWNDFEKNFIEKFKENNPKETPKNFRQARFVSEENNLPPALDDHKIQPSTNEIVKTQASPIVYEEVDNANIIIEFYTENVYNEFSKNGSIFDDAFRKLVHIKCENGVWNPECGNSYLIPHTLSLVDNYGEWEKDFFYGHLKIFLKTNKTSQNLPKSWKTDKNKVREFKIEKIKKIKIKKSDKEVINEDDDGDEESVNNFREDIDQFMNKFLAKHQRTEFSQQLKKQFEKMYINSVNDLITLPGHSWDSLQHNLGPVITMLLKKEVELRKTNAKAKKDKEKEQTAGEILADIHKIKRYLLFETKLKNPTTKKLRLEDYGYLDSNALEKGFQEQAEDKKFDGGPIMDKIKCYLQENFSIAHLPDMIKPSYGMILWGPPGTGKTRLCEIMCLKAGIELVVEPLSSSELNRSKVGETEQLLMALFRRAEALPHLLCCIAIDEIDALTPKRNEKSGEHKVDALCLLLSLIGGIKKVENVFVIASTNRLNKMDEAFCRRLQVKYFVGRLDPERRLNMLCKIESDIKLDRGSPRFTKYQHSFLQKLTTNFSGAALESFRSRIISYLIKYDKLEINNKDLIEIADKVAQDFQIMLGTNTIPILLKDIDNTKTNENEDNLIQNGRKYTGKILVDLSDQKCAIIQLEYDYYDERREQDEKRLQVLKLPEVNLTHDVIPTLLKLSISENVEFLQMFDTSMLLNNAAFDDNTVMECVLEKLGEWQQYQRSMAIFDVDSLIGVSENMSDSSMGQSNSYSITNNRLWHQVVIQTTNSKLNDSGSSASGPNAKKVYNKNHKWVVVITKNEFICKQFKTLTRFPLTREEIIEKEESEKERRCINCEMKYTNNKNNIDSCSYHDAPLVDIRVKDNQMIHLDKKNLFATFVKTNADRQELLKHFVYLCCFQTSNSTGCKKDFHSDHQDNKDYEKYEKYF